MEVLIDHSSCCRLRVADVKMVAEQNINLFNASIPLTSQSQIGAPCCEQAQAEACQDFAASAAALFPRPSS